VDSFIIQILSKFFYYIKAVRIRIASLILKKFIITTEVLLQNKLKTQETIYIENDQKFNIKPTGQVTTDRYFSKWIGEHDVKGQFLIMLKNAYIVTEWAIPVTDDGQIIIETSGKLSSLLGNLVSRSKTVWFTEYKLIFFLLCIKISKFLKFNFFSKKKIKTPLFHVVPRHGFSFIDGPTFSHWIFENLPQLRMYFKAISYESNIKLYLGGIIKEWQIETLKLLGINEKKIFKYKQPFFSKLSEIYICRLPIINSSGIKFDPVGRSWVNQTIRHSLSEKNFINSKIPKFKKIAFSRKYCSRRRILNEDQFLDVLNGKGYKIIYPEKISENEKIFNSYYAKTILGFPSGSALANFIFSQRPRLIEIQNKDKLIPVWFLLSQELEMSYSLKFANFKGNKPDFRDNNFIINSENFEDDL